MTKTKFKIGSKPWCVKFDKDEQRYIVFESEEPITAIHIIIYEGGEGEHPYWGLLYDKEYSFDCYPTREEAIKAAKEFYKADADQLKADISYIEWKMEELENE